MITDPLLIQLCADVLGISLDYANVYNAEGSLAAAAGVVVTATFVPN